MCELFVICKKKKKKKKATLKHTIKKNLKFGAILPLVLLSAGKRKSTSAKNCQLHFKNNRNLFSFAISVKYWCVVWHSWSLSYDFCLYDVPIFYNQFNNNNTSIGHILFFLFLSRRYWRDTQAAGIVTFSVEWSNSNEPTVPNSIGRGSW